MAGLDSKQLRQLDNDFPSLGDGPEGKSLRAFIAHYYHNNASDELGRRNLDDLIGAARFAHELARRQQLNPEGLLLEVYNPNLDEHGWHSSHTVIQCLQPNKPFLLDSIINQLHNLDLQIHFMAHPMLHWQDGNVATGLNADRSGISLIHIEIDALGSLDELQELSSSLGLVLRDVDHAVADWQPMLANLDNFNSSLPADDSRLDFLKWLRDNRFTFLGYRYFALSKKNYHAEHQLNLGVLRDPDTKAFPIKPEGGWHPLVHKMILANSGLLICKGSKKSRVHRSIYPDIILCKQYQDGKEVGVHLWLGLFTSASYQDPLLEVPILRSKVAELLKRFNFHSNSHNGKALLDIFHKVPRDELLQMDSDSLYDYCRTVLNIQERRSLALFVHRDQFRRYVTVTIFLPKDKVDTTLRERCAEHLAQAFQGKVADFRTVMTDDHLSRIQYIISVDFPDQSAVDEEKLLSELEVIASDWLDTLRRALVEKHGEARGLSLMRSIGTGFPSNYREHNRALVACNDIDHIDYACQQGYPTANIGKSFRGASTELHCKLYSPNSSVHLSDIVPILENLGVRVLGDTPYQIKVNKDGVKTFWLHDFVLDTSVDVELGTVRELAHEYLHRIFRKELENDSLSQLILKAGLAPDQVAILRMFARLLNLLVGNYSAAFIRSTLVAHAGIARLLLDLFAAQLAGSDADAVDAKIDAALAEVQSLAEDTVLSQLRSVIKAGVRCNIDTSSNTISFKFAPQELAFAPQPAPWREVFVYALDFEAVHFRFGRVARGGLRWSDRSEDFRTEILGLVKAQQVKNSVIVPQGAKGGFILKGEAVAGAQGEQFLKLGIAAYKRFMACLLALTDNRVGGTVERHGDLLRADNEDTYLVVAADKGTASFSDYANEVAEQHKFWLGDGFASGGSQGYDHKKMGITARGAWEAVRQHFYQLGQDIQSQRFSVIGVGDMGGDVFGNGMLLSPCIQLRAAFNHRHIFIDPDPDPESSFQERQRLFDLASAASGWDHYDRELLSEGGAIFERQAKRVQLSPQIKRLLGISKNTCSPDEVLAHILTMEVDLLWFGGIGTYIKASSESHADVSDRGNDGIRVDANQVRAKVIGEGANLGLSASARVEYSLAGGLCNTDFIDNCAGVNCSDHEVNIKILLALVLEQGTLSPAQRNQLLEDMTDAVAELVLATSRAQALAISASALAQHQCLPAHQRTIALLERNDFLSRAVENLPDDKLLATRARQGLGLARPEICTLQSYAKNYLFAQLTEHEVDLRPLAGQWLRAYFPEVLQERYPELVAQHPLGGEIIATKVTNAVVDIGGLEFINEVVTQGDSSLARAVGGFLMLDAIFGLRGIWQQQLELMRSDSATALGNINKLRQSLQLLCIWLVNNESELAPEGVDFYRQHAPLALRQLSGEDASWEQLLLSDPVSIIACLKISRIARAHATEPAQAAAWYQQLEQSLSMDQLIRLATSHQATSHWQQLALRSHQNELEELQMQILGNIVDSSGDLGLWLQERQELVAASTLLLDEIHNQPTFEIPMLKVAIDNLKKLRKLHGVADL